MVNTLKRDIIVEKQKIREDSSVPHLRQRIRQASIHYNQNSCCNQSLCGLIIDLL